MSAENDNVYMVVPLLGVALLLLIALFLIWRCQLQKATRRRPAYTQNRYLVNRNTRSLPRILVHRDAPSHSDNSHTNDRPSMVICGGERSSVISGTLDACALQVQNSRGLYVQDPSMSVASRLSGATPPPSYEEVVGHLDSSSDETTATYNDPPPKYEEIVKEK